MRHVALAGFLAVLCGGTVGAARADITVTSRTQAYNISGRTGAALLREMDKRGPKHGFLTRAIAQTGYSVAWTIEWGESAKSCHVNKIDGALAITYTFPRVSGVMSADLKRRWGRFTTGVRKHEETHGALARQMANAAEKSIARLTVPNDPGCRKARAEAKRRMAAVYADYEARQIKFDTKEHRAGGRVEGLIASLTRR